MSEELLKLDKLPTIKELDFLLLDVLNRKHPIQLYDLSSICRSSSFNFALSFDNCIRFLSSIDLIKVHKDDSVSRNIDRSELQHLKGDHSLCIFITQKLVKYLIDNSLLEKVFNEKVVHFNFPKDTFSINTNSIPLEYPMVKEFLINMGVAYPDQNSKGRILIANVYKHYFKNEILTKAFDQGVVAIDTKEILEIVVKNKSLFISYSHVDEAVKEELIKHLSGLKRMGLISEWNDRKILPGEEWSEEIKKKLEQADIIIFLISADFIASDYINDVELQKAIERHNKYAVTIIPVIVRPCDFESIPISKYQALPKNAKPISKWDDRDEALLDVVNGIKRLL